MSLTIQNSDLIGAATQISLGVNDDLVVADGTIVATTSTAYVITGAGSNNITINGSVFGQSHALNISGDANRVVVGTTGYVAITTGDTNIAAIYLKGDNAVLINHGVVDGGSALTTSQGFNGSILNTGTVTGTSAFIFDTLDANSTGTVVNSGYAFGEDFGFRIFGSDSSVAYSITNTGTLGGNILAVRAGSGQDEVINAGQIIGDIDMGQGNDVFDGRGGTVLGKVIGGLGDDMYIVDDETLQLFEFNDEGTDEVNSLVNWKLGEGFEDLVLLGGGDLRGVGNDENNVIFGNEGDNLIRGRAGNDILDGGAGDDWILGHAGGDTLRGGDDDDMLIGGGGKDKIYGDGGDDVLKGGNGLDRLWGGDGLDTFVFNRVGHSTNDTNADVIKDFASGSDLIDFSDLIAGDLTYLGNGSFTGGAAEVRWVINSTNVILRVDADGDGSADMKVVLEGIASLTEADFIL